MQPRPRCHTESRTRAQQMTDCEKEDRSKQSGLFANRRRRIEPTIAQRCFLLPGLEPDFRTLRQQRPEGSHAWGEVRSGLGSDKIFVISHSAIHASKQADQQNFGFRAALFCPSKDMHDQLGKAIRTWVTFFVSMGSADPAISVIWISPL